MGLLSVGWKDGLYFHFAEPKAEQSVVSTDDGSTAPATIKWFGVPDDWLWGHSQREQAPESEGTGLALNENGLKIEDEVSTIEPGFDGFHVRGEYGLKVDFASDGFCLWSIFGGIIPKKDSVFLDFGPGRGKFGLNFETGERVCQLEKL